MVFVEGKKMASKQTRIEPESTFTFAVRELRKAGLVQPLPDAVPLTVTNEHRGFDPYNTSGSLDHRRIWIRARNR
jgi:hypothetical protein